MKGMLAPAPIGRSNGRRLSGEGGQAAIFAALTLTLMFSAMGLAVDLGWAYFLKERVQTAADAAASAAAVYALNNGDTCASVTCGTSYSCAGVTPPTNSLQAGCLFGTVDGPPILSATLIENDSAHPPSGLSGVTPSMWIKASVSSSSSNAFLFLSGFKSASINAQAIGGVTSTGSGNCIYALSGSGTSLSTSGSNTISSTCGIFDNGGFSFVGSGSISTTQMLVNGNFSFGGSGNITATKKIQIGGTYSKVGSGTLSPAYTAGSNSITDPFVTVSSPTVGACTYNNTKITGSSGASLTPGVYCGGIDIAGSGDVSFASGTYIINGGGAQYSFKYSGSGNLTGTNVTFYITGQNGYTAEPIHVSGSGNMSFSAPSSGSYKGLLFYQDRTITYAGSNTFTGSGSVTGSLYFPTTTLSFSGSNTAQAQALVAQSISFVGSTSLKADTSGSLTGLATEKAVMLQ